MFITQFPLNHKDFLATFWGVFNKLGTRSKPRQPYRFLFGIVQRQHRHTRRRPRLKTGLRRINMLLVLIFGQKLVQLHQNRAPLIGVRFVRRSNGVSHIGTSRKIAAFV